MMIAKPTAASAAATVMTKNTNTCPATPYCCANATKVRFTALSINSTHMNTMIALRRISTPNTPITNSKAEKKSASASIVFSTLFAEHYRADDRREKQNARHLEGEEVLVEERRGDRGDCTGLRDLLRRESLRERQRHRRARFGEGKDLGENGQAHRAGGQLPAKTTHVGDAAMTKIEKHDHEEEHDHDRPGV